MGRESTPPSAGGHHGPSKATIPVVPGSCVVPCSGLPESGRGGGVPSAAARRGRERAALWAYGAESTPAVVPVPPVERSTPLGRKTCGGPEPRDVGRC